MLSRKEKIFVYPSSTLPGTIPKPATWDERLYDMFVTKPFLKNTVAFAVTILGLAQAKGFIVSLLFGGLILNIWQWVVECKFRKIFAIPIIFILCPFLVIKVMPYVQNKVVYPNLNIHSLQNREDAQEISVIVDNVGSGVLREKETTICYGFSSLEKEGFIWKPALDLIDIPPGVPGGGTVISFEREQKIPQASFSVVLIENKKLLNGYLMETFFTSNAGNSWGRYKEKIGRLGKDHNKLIKGFLRRYEVGFQSQNWGKLKWMKDILES